MLACGRRREPQCHLERSSEGVPLKRALVALIRPLLRLTRSPVEGTRRLIAHASLSVQLRSPLPASVVVVGSGEVHGTGVITLGENILLYPGFYFESIQGATLSLGPGCVLSRGVHITARTQVSIGEGTMIGEYTSVRDSNHERTVGMTLRDAPYQSAPIVIGREVWLGRGVTVLPGISIGDGATVGANAVVTRDIPPGETWGGVPARLLKSSVSRMPPV